MNNSKIIVTGAAGFMGSHLVNSLIKRGHKYVFGVDDLSGGYIENVNPKSYFTKLDLRDRKKTEEYVDQIKSPDILFHLAADATESRSQFTPIACTERNYLAYLNILIPSIKRGVKKVILVSSMSVYGAQKAPFDEVMPRLPEDIYGISKSAMEQATEVLSKVYNLKYVIIRPHNVYGPGQNLSDPYRNVVGIFINRLLNNSNFYIYGDGEQKRAFTYIDDFTPYIIKAAFMKKAEGEIFNIGPVEEYTINKLANVILKTFFPNGIIPQKFRPKYVPMRPMEVKEAWCTVDKAKKLLSYKTKISLEEGIKTMIEWASKKGAQKFKYLDNLELINKNTPITWKEKLI